ncbi:DNA-binding NarL/FixJ family response regulator [Catenulispora sp. EB89]|uniref:response regulator n=1 Tax=Catenulispora sp. EB89 TaxID=3156257 RepID=UPI0035116F08
MIRVLIADDQTLLRGSLRLLLDSQADLTVVAEAANGNEAVERACSELPDVVLMDIRMPELDGLAATRAIAERHPHVRVLVLTTFDLDEYVYGALRAGASGFLLKDTPPADLVAAIRVVAAGEALLAPGITKRLIEEFARIPEPGRRPTTELSVITDREKDVLELIGRGLTNQEIALRLILSPATVKTHVSRLLTKLGARDRAQLVIVAYESGLIVATR